MIKMFYSLLNIFIIINLVQYSSQADNKHQSHSHNHHKYDDKQTIDESQPPILSKLLIPNIPAQHFQYWLKNYPLTYSQFNHLCNQVKDPLGIDDPQLFQSLHVNFTFEDQAYLKNHNYGKRVLHSICTNIADVPKSCWGYENNCQNIYLMPECYGSSLGQAKTKQEHKILWFNQADFGYVLERRREINRYCIADKQSDDPWKSSFDCIKNFKSCRGDNLFINIKSIFNNYDAQNPEPKSLAEVMKPGDIGGWNCDLQSKRIPEEGGQEGELQSWFAELKNYQLLSTHISPEKSCEVILDKQVYFVKQDSFANLYHYMTTFVNLYITMHLNNRFFEDNQIIIWDSKPQVNSRFDILWSAFSKNKPLTLADYKGKRVCFQKYIFTLPPRMINGLYYNTPLVSGCSKTGLFDAFNKHLLHKLNVPQYYYPDLHVKSNNSIVRIVILSRSTPSRRITNEQELKKSLIDKSLLVELMDYAELEFQKTLGITLNADILIGIHGAGLTNMLFLPDWAAVIELYDCGDKAYFDLARLRGVSYFTLINKDDDKKLITKISNSSTTNEDDDKQANYTINKDAFLETVDIAIKRMKSNRAKHFDKIGYKLFQTPPVAQPQSEPRDEL